MRVGECDIAANVRLRWKQQRGSAQASRVAAWVRYNKWWCCESREGRSEIDQQYHNTQQRYAMACAYAVVPVHVACRKAQEPATCSARSAASLPSRRRNARLSIVSQAQPEAAAAAPAAKQGGGHGHGHGMMSKETVRVHERGLDHLHR